MLAVYAGLRGLTITASALAALVLNGCSEDPIGTPGPRAERDTVVLAFRGDSARFVSMGARSGRAFDRRFLDADLRFLNGIVADKESRIVYAGVRSGTKGSAELWAAEVAGLTVRWRKRLEDLEAELTDGTELTLTGQVALDRSGRRLYLFARRGPDREPGEFGVVPVDVKTQTPLGYLGGFKAGNRKIAPVRATNSGPELLVVGAPRSAEAVRLMIYRAEGEGLPVLQDSVFLFEPPPLDDRSVRLDKVVSFRDGRHVFVRSRDSVFKVDVRNRHIVERAPRARFVISAVAVLQDPARLVLTDAGSFDFPGSGELQLYDGGLNDLGTFDGGPGAMRRIVVGPQGDRVFVGSGTGRFMGFIQEARLTMVDVREREVLRVHDIGGFGFVGPVDVF